MTTEHETRNAKLLLSPADLANYLRKLSLTVGNTQNSKFSEGILRTKLKTTKEPAQTPYHQQ